MQLENSTHNQHFVSQAEQRLNTCNPDIQINKKAKIYAFEITDRESYTTTLRNNNGSPIVKTLALRDLFSFHVEEDMRWNLEKPFETYEAQIIKHTTSLLTKLSDSDCNVKSELLGIFAAKLLNSFRNPYSVKKTLNTLGTFLPLAPSDSVSAETHRLIERGSKPHMATTCGLLGITEAEYVQWVECLFMLLVEPKEGASNMFDAIIKTLHENKSLVKIASIYHYTGEHKDKRTLISDRGYWIDEEEQWQTTYGFNLNSNSFLTYSFTNLHKLPTSFNIPSAVDLFQRLPSELRVHYDENDLTVLQSFNQRSLYHSKSEVFSSSRSPWGVKVVE